MEQRYAITVKFLVNADGSGAELYNVVADPKETKNLAKERPDLADLFRSAVLRWRKGQP